MSLALAAALAANVVTPACNVPPRTTAEDRAAMLSQLGISATRPGPSGDRNNPNAANWDEAKVGETPPMPDPLRFDSGRPFRGAFDWVQRRREIVAHFEEEVFGRVPNNVPPVEWTTRSLSRTTIGNIPVLDRQVVGTVRAYRCSARSIAISLRVVTPESRTGRVPAVMSLAFQFGPNPPPLTPTSFTGQLVANGFAHVTLIPTSVQADNGAGLTGGIIGITNDGRLRKPDEWGVIRAWAWGASRSLDYLANEPAIDTRRVAIEGLSRYGKAALAVLAFDQRFAGGLIGSSGEGGASPYRRNFGEALENVAGSGEYHWMAGNFMRYGADPLRAADMPVDANSLIALAAPRPILIGAGNLDADWWVDPRGSFLAAVSADPVWRLLGGQGLSTTSYPEANVFVGSTGLSFRRHTGGHDNTPNIPTFIQFSKESWAR